MVKESKSIFGYKGLLRVFFVFAFIFLFFKVNLDFRINQTYSSHKAENYINKTSSHTTVSFSDKNIVEDNSPDFYDNELEGLESPFILFEVQKIQNFVFNKTIFNYFIKTKSVLKQPLYILFCNLKIHLA